MSSPTLFTPSQKGDTATATDDFSHLMYTEFGELDIADPMDFDTLLSPSDVLAWMDETAFSGLEPWSSLEDLYPLDASPRAVGDAPIQDHTPRLAPNLHLPSFQPLLPEEAQPVPQFECPEVQYPVALLLSKIEGKGGGQDYLESERSFLICPESARYSDDVNEWGLSRVMEEAAEELVEQSNRPKMKEEEAVRLLEEQLGGLKLVVLREDGIPAKNFLKFFNGGGESLGEGEAMKNDGSPELVVRTPRPARPMNCRFSLSL